MRADVDAWTAQGHRPPHLAVVLVGDNPASASYVRGKMKASREAGIESETLKYDADLSEAELLQLIDRLNHDDTVDGILATRKKGIDTRIKQIDDNIARAERRLEQMEASLTQRFANLEVLMNRLQGQGGALNAIGNPLFGQTGGSGR